MNSASKSKYKHTCAHIHTHTLPEVETPGPTALNGASRSGHSNHTVGRMKATSITLPTTPSRQERKSQWRKKINTLRVP